MCGIAGIWDGTRTTRDEQTERVAAMAGELIHRGPDAGDVWVDEDAGVALAHRRLSILDLSSAGAQPMHSTSGRWVVTYNGEIYNFRQLCRRLEQSGHRPRGGSDTEVLLLALEEWGFDEALHRIQGMFAFALWDRREHCLYLVRDRLGKKPLYVYRRPDLVLFGSELKALCSHPAFPRRLDPQAAFLYSRYHYIPAPYAAFENTVKLQPGHYMVIRRHGRTLSEPRPISYWDPLQIASRSRCDLVEPQAATDELEGALRTAIAERMVADVPLGSLLSGGIDSSLVVALMQSLSARPVRTYTIGFDDPEHDEAAEARGVAEHLGTEHTELYVTPEDSLAVIPEMPDVYDEPFGDPSQVPTLVVARLARQAVTVALAGDGGDELFGGYNRYAWADQLWRKVGWAPDSVRRAAASSLRLLSPQMWDRLMSLARPLLPQRMGMRLYGDKAYKLANILDAGGREYVYRRLISYFERPEEILEATMATRGAGVEDPVLRLQTRISRDLGISDFTFRMMLLDMKTYLPEDILVKVDRASMATSLEIRAPLLDQRLMELSCRIPMALKVHNGCTKWILRQVLYRYVPATLVDRPKAGFGVPIGPWLRGPLRDWAEDLLEPKALTADSIFDPAAVQRLWRQHLSGTHDWKYHLWGILMFQAWQRRWLGAAGPSAGERRVS